MQYALKLIFYGLLQKKNDFFLLTTFLWQYCSKIRLILKVINCNKIDVGKMGFIIEKWNKNNKVPRVLSLSLRNCIK